MQITLPLAAAMVATAGAFAPGVPTRSLSTTAAPSQLRAMDIECDDDGCIIPDEEEESLLSAAVANQGASAFRNSMLTDVDGNLINLGEKMGPGKSVVVFLRHLA
jgi:hypothetical protein